MIDLTVISRNIRGRLLGAHAEGPVVNLPTGPFPQYLPCQRLVVSAVSDGQHTVDEHVADSPGRLIGEGWKQKSSARLASSPAEPPSRFS